MLTTLNQTHIHDEGCRCCHDLVMRQFGRRRFLQVAGGVMAGALLPQAFAASGKYDAMLLTCIDPRFQEPVAKYTASRKLTGKYSQFTIAGASIGVVAPALKGWHQAFWDNLGTSVKLHSIEKVIVINHRDCGAAKIAYGEASVKDAATETKTHREVAAAFRAEMKKQFPKLGVETYLMALDGKAENIG
jgi:carbonic anhydrase